MRVVCRGDFCEHTGTLLTLLQVKCALFVYTKIMRNITLSAADLLIDRAREKARAEGVTLNDEFRKWLASYVEAQDGQTAVDRFRTVMQGLPAVDAGRSFSRDEMNER